MALTSRRPAGQRGNGPGEFQGISGSLAGAPATRSWCSDLFARRLTSSPTPGSSAGPLRWAARQVSPSRRVGDSLRHSRPGLFADGRVLAMRAGFSGQRREPGRLSRLGRLRPVHRRGRRPRHRGSILRVSRWTQVTMSFGDRTFNAPSPVPLGRNTIVARPRAPVHRREERRLGNRRAFRFEDTCSGSFGSRSLPVPITAENQTAHRRRRGGDRGPADAAIDATPDQAADDRPGEGDVYPKTFPFIASVLPASDGTLWVYEQGTPGDERSGSSPCFDSDRRFPRAG